MEQIIQINDVTIGNGRPKICVPLVAETIEELQQQLLLMEGKPFDLIEWRADYYRDIFLEDAFMEAFTMLKEYYPETPCIFTFRTAQEGGERDLTIAQYQTLLTFAARQKKFEIIDIEVFKEKLPAKELIHRLKGEGAVVLASNHDFTQTLASEILYEKLKKMRELGADIVKIAVMPQSKMDVLQLMEAACAMKEEKICPVVAMSMGKLGAVSRIAGQFFGSDITFASVAQASAPGQIEALKLEELLHQLELFL